MRLFIAVDFDHNTKNKIYELQKELKEKSIKGRWRYIDNFHLTLKFLDEVDVNKVRLLNQTLTECSGIAKNFKIKIDKLGCFKGNDSIRTVWLGISGELQKLNSLYTIIEEKLENMGLLKENRGYKPHVTIGQDVAFQEDFEILKELIKKYQFDEMSISKFVLVKSEQIGNKRVYTTIGEYNLGN